MSKKKKKKKRKQCWWNGCSQLADFEKYGLCSKHYYAYKKEQLESTRNYYAPDFSIRCLNANLSDEKISVSGQWNHGNNK